MGPRARTILIAGGLALLALLTCAGPALAQGTEAAGAEIGDTIRNIAGPIVWSLGGLTALGAFFKRDVGLAFTTLVITIIVGGFIVGHAGIEAFTYGLWERVFPPAEALPEEEGALLEAGRFILWGTVFPKGG